eukprot:2298649-Alexandrium_andersonii.AAC.1
MDGAPPGRYVAEVHLTPAPAARDRLCATVRAATAAESAPSTRRFHSHAARETGLTPRAVRSRH